MGVVNATPDSFSDGGEFFAPAVALAHARKLCDEGADIIDLGAESTRPGAAEISPDEEWRRLAPVLGPVRKMLDADYPHVELSVDTRKPELMLRAADAGADYINDVSGQSWLEDRGVTPPSRDPETAKKLAKRGLAYIAMHMHGTPQSMQVDPLGGKAAVSDVESFFAAAHEFLRIAGFPNEKIWLDPGIGFGKNDRGNFHLLAATRHWATDYQLVVGISRKGFIGRALGIEKATDRDGPSKLLEVGLAAAGARMIRTHDVKTLRKLLDLMQLEDGK